MKINRLAIMLYMATASTSALASYSNYTVSTNASYSFKSSGFYNCNISINNVGSLRENVQIAITEYNNRNTPILLKKIVSSSGYSTIDINDNHWAQSGNKFDYLQSCAPTDAIIEGRGRAIIAYKFPSTHRHVYKGADLSWPIPTISAPLSNQHLAKQVIALPFAAKISEDDKILSYQHKTLQDSGLSDSFDAFTELLNSENSGIRGNVYGFSEDFLSLKNHSDINQFILERIIKPASELGLIANSDDFLNLNFANEVRKEILYLLSQDIEEVYGSISQVKNSFILKYSQKVSSGIQFNQANVRFNSKLLSRIETDMYQNETINNELKEKYDVNSLYEIEEYFNDMASYEDLSDPKDLANSILNGQNGIKIDFSKGLISNSNRKHGYLGQTFLEIASDAYNKEIRDITSRELKLVEIALNGIGIDTSYPYGSMRNIQSSILMRVDAALSEEAFNAELEEGSSGELLNALKDVHNINFEPKVKELLYDTYVYSGVDGIVPQGIVLFDGLNQSGNSIVLNSSTPSLGGFANQMESFHIPHGWKVRFYNQPNFEGGYYTRLPGTYNADGFRKTVASVEVMQIPSSAAEMNREGVWLYDLANKGGESFQFRNSASNLASLDRRVSSYRLPAGWKVRFYDQENFTGRYWTSNKSSVDRDINITGFDNLARSVKVLEVPATLDAAVLYSNTGLAGDLLIVDQDMPDLQHLDRQMSSYRIPDGWEVRFFTEKNFGGGYYTRTSGSSNAIGFDNVVRSIKILKKPAEGKELYKEHIYDLLKSSNELTKIVESFERIVDYDADGTPIYSIPLSDENYTRALLYDVGFDKAFVEKEWRRFFNQQNVRPIIHNYFPSNQIPTHMANRWKEIQDEFEAESGRTRYFVQDMWSHNYNKMARAISEHIASSISFEAKLAGRTPWIESDTRKITVRLNMAFDIVKTRHHSSWRETEYVEPDNFVISGEGINYSAKLGNSVFDIFDLSKMSIHSPIALSGSNQTHPVFRALNAARAPDCNVPSQYPSNDLITSCAASYMTRDRTTPDDVIALSYLLEQYLASQKNSFNGENAMLAVIEMMKGFIPVWGTIDAIKSGNPFDISLSLLGDLFMFVPLVDDFADIATFSTKAIKASKVASKAKFAKTPVGLTNGNKLLVASGNVDSVYYTQKTIQSVKKLGLTIVDELSPIGLGTISASGRVKIPSRPSLPTVPDVDVGIDINKNLSSLIQGDISIVRINSDGTYIINDNILAIQQNGFFFRVEIDGQGNYFLLKNNGTKLPIIRNGGLWEVNTYNSLAYADLTDFITITDEMMEGAVKQANGIYKLPNGDFAIKFDGVNYKVHYDPVYDSWLIYDSNWNRLHIAGEYEDEWLLKYQDNFLTCSIH